MRVAVAVVRKKRRRLCIVELLIQTSILSAIEWDSVSKR
jgi:hypothetical protein